MSDKLLKVNIVYIYKDGASTVLHESVYRVC